VTERASGQTTRKAIGRRRGTERSERETATLAISVTCITFGILFRPSKEAAAFFPFVFFFALLFRWRASLIQHPRVVWGFRRAGVFFFLRGRLRGPLEPVHSPTSRTAREERAERKTAEKKARDRNLQEKETHGMATMSSSYSLPRDQQKESATHRFKQRASQEFQNLTVRIAPSDLSLSVLRLFLTVINLFQNSGAAPRVGRSHARRIA